MAPLRTGWLTAEAKRGIITQCVPHVRRLRSLRGTANGNNTHAVQRGANQHDTVQHAVQRGRIWSSSNSSHYHSRAGSFNKSKWWSWWWIMINFLFEQWLILNFCFIMVAFLSLNKWSNYDWSRSLSAMIKPTTNPLLDASFARHAKPRIGHFALGTC